jgi:hypothetical protein
MIWLKTIRLSTVRVEAFRSFSSPRHQSDRKRSTVIVAPGWSLNSGAFFDFGKVVA